MANSEDYSLWRHQTNGGIKYRFLGMDGGFDFESGEISWRGLFRSQDLLAITSELFPAHELFGNIPFARAGVMPGFNTLAAKKLTFRSFDESKPIDSFDYDGAAPVGTYNGFIHVTVTFGTQNRKNIEPDDPRTFLEITSEVGGEFIYAPPEGTQLQDETNALGEDDEEVGEGAIAAGTGEVDTSGLTNDAKRPNRSPILPSTILVPTTQWTVRWKQIPYNHFKNVIIHRLRIVNGRVNSSNVGFLYNAYPETLLCTGWNHTESYSWRSANVEAPPIDVEIKLLEKRVNWRNIICGHNHVWEPGIGWRRMWVGENHDEHPYRHINMNFLFQV